MYDEFDELEWRNMGCPSMASLMNNARSDCLKIESLQTKLAKAVAISNECLFIIAGFDCDREKWVEEKRNELEALK